MRALARAAASAVVAAALASGCDGARDTAPPAVRTDTLPPEADFLRQVDRTRGVKDCFTVLRDPEFVEAGSAPHMADGETVVALDLGEVQVCYPVQYLNHHEIVEHRLAGLELLACW